MNKYVAMMLFALILFGVVDLSEVNALTGGLLNGKPMIYSSGNPTSLATDNNSSTRASLSVIENRLSYIVPDGTFKVNSFQINYNSSSGIANLGVIFYDDKGEKISGFASPKSGASISTGLLQNVKKVEIARTNVDVNIFEIDVFGELVIEPNKDVSKFVINNLEYTATSDTSISLKWDAVNSTYLKKYNIYVDGILKTYMTTNTYSMSNLVPGKTYAFKVTPVDTFDKEFEGSTIEYKVQVPDTTPPDPVKGVKVQPSRTDALVTWNKNTESDLAGYTVYLDGRKSSANLLTTESYKLTGLKPKTDYKVYVVAQDKAGNVSAKSDEISFTTTNPATDSDQEQTPDYILVTWTETAGAVSYEILLNGKVVGTAPAGTTSFKITKAMGYNPQNMTNKTLVRAKFADGSTGEGNNSGGDPYGGGWGFDGSDVWKNVVLIVGSLSLFLILGICIKLAPRVFTLIRSTISK